MKRVLPLVLAALLVLALGACGEEGGKAHHPNSGDKKAAPPAPPAGQGNGKKEHKPEDEDAPDGQVGLFVTWTAQSKTKVACEWARNGKSTQCNVEDPEHDDEEHQWYGFWETFQLAKAGDVFTINAQGTGAVTKMNCEVLWQHKFHEALPENRKPNRCSISFTVT